MDLKIHVDIKGDELRFVVTGTRDDGTILESSVGVKDLNTIKDLQDKWFLGLAWVCTASPRAVEIYISNRTIVDIANTIPLEAAIKKVVGSKEAFKTYAEWMKRKKLTFIEPKDNLAITKTHAPAAVADATTNEPAKEAAKEEIITGEPEVNTSPAPHGEAKIVTPKPPTPPVKKTHREK